MTIYLAETAVDYLEQRARLWSEPDLSQGLQWRDLERPNRAWAQRCHAAFDAGMEFLDFSEVTERHTRQLRRALTLGGAGLASVMAIVMFLFRARAQHGSNEVAAFVDANQVDRLKTDCPMIFAPHAVPADEGPGDEAVAGCLSALRRIPGLVEGIADHHKIREDLDSGEEDTSVFKRETLEGLLGHQERFHDAPLLMEPAGRSESRSDLASTWVTAARIKVSTPLSWRSMWRNGGVLWGSWWTPWAPAGRSPVKRRPARFFSRPGPSPRHRSAQRPRFAAPPSTSGKYSS